jgi:phospholipid/cholesterol/gamma-HCH transport system ATP-binding protein
MSSSEPKQALIEVRDVTMAYGTNVIQSDLTFDIYQGDIFVIMGGSGCWRYFVQRHQLLQRQ